jgi:hypothetical protein
VSELIGILLCLTEIEAQYMILCINGLASLHGEGYKPVAACPDLRSSQRPWVPIVVYNIKFSYKSLE